MKRLLALTVAIFLTCGALSVSARELFDDVSDSDWAAQYIYNLTDRGIIGGYGDGTFRQFDNVQRCEYAKMLVNIAKIPIVASAVSPYTDVPASEWFFRYINSVSSYMTGFQDSDGTLFFAPEEAATREAVAVAMSLLQWLRQRASTQFNMTIPTAISQKDFRIGRIFQPSTVLTSVPRLTTESLPVTKTEPSAPATL